MMNMDREIFNLKVSTEATSFYIIVCALMDQGIPPTLPEVRARWTSTEESLIAAAEELVKRGVLNSPIPVPEDMHLHPTTRDWWRW